MTELEKQMKLKKRNAYGLPYNAIRDATIEIAEAFLRPVYVAQEGFDVELNK